MINWGDPIKSFGGDLVLAGKSALGAASQLIANAVAEFIVKPSTMYKVECFDAWGRLKWSLEVPNLVMTSGKNELLDKTFKASGYTATWYVGLVDNASFSAYAAGDIMSSHAGWLESTAYSNANRPTLTLGTVSGGSVDNSGAVAAFSINATATIRGAFVVNNNTKGGTTGTLYGAADFGAARAVVNGDTLNVTTTLTIS